jgi:hypothetical protein
MVDPTDVPPTTLVCTLFHHLNEGDLDAMRPHAAEDEFQDLPDGPWRLTGTFTGAPFYGVTVTGRRIDIRDIDRFTIGDDGPPP